MNKLEELALKYGSHKCPKIVNSYTTFYDHFFADKRNSIHKVLEIGVGPSLNMWKDYFPKAIVYGIDIEEDLVFKKGRIQTFLCNQANSDKLTRLIKKIGSDINLVIDDGSHHPKDIIAACKTLLPLLNKDVTYVIEQPEKPDLGMIMEGLKDFDIWIWRLRKMRSSSDRLIIVSNKTA